MSIPNDKDQFQSDIPEDQSAKGDLDIRSKITINGAGSTTVNGADLDRVFDVVGFTAAAAEISGLTITNGNVQTSEDGGGISVGFGTTLDLEDSTVSDNTVFFRGGGIKNLDALTMTNSAVIDNTATNGTPRCDIGAFELFDTPADLSIDKLAPSRATQKAKFA